jgi:hypothetical protein
VNTHDEESDTAKHFEDKLLKVFIENEHDFNKLLGVITAVRSANRSRDMSSGFKLGRSYGHVVVKIGVVSEGNRWADVVFMGLCVPQVDGCVLYGDGLEDDGSDTRKYQQRGGALERKDMLYAMEDCSDVAGILERRVAASASGDEKKIVECNENGALTKLCGKYLYGKSCVRTFVHMEARKFDEEETKDNASGMLWASSCQGM